MDSLKLTASEWNVLNCLWEHSPRTVMQLVGELERTVGWARSTTITTLHRMEAKELVRRHHDRGACHRRMDGREPYGGHRVHPDDGHVQQPVQRGLVGVHRGAGQRRRHQDGGRARPGGVPVRRDALLPRIHFGGGGGEGRPRGRQAADGGGGLL